MVSNTYRKWVPEGLVRYLVREHEIAAMATALGEGRVPDKSVELYERLAKDERMREVWEWHATAFGDETLQHWNGLGFAIRVRNAMTLPLKPGDMPPKKRDEYLAKVRTHVEALITLLRGTKFDCGWDEGSRLPIDLDGEVKLELFQEILEINLLGGRRSFLASDRHPDDEIDRIQAYLVRWHGINKLPWDYPQCHLVELLYKVVQWTYFDDFWGRGFQSSKAIRQSGDRARIKHFNCVLYESMLRDGISIPYQILATLASVALDLDEQLDVDIVQKQVKRYLGRLDNDEDRMSVKIRTSLISDQ